MIPMDPPPEIEDRDGYRPNERQGYSTREVAEITGASYRQLDFWCRIGLVVPDLGEAHGSGSRRRWSQEDLDLIQDVVALMERGFRLRHAFEEAYAGVGQRTLSLSEVETEDEDSEVGLVQRALRYTAIPEGSESFSDVERLMMLEIAERLEQNDG